MKLLKMCLVSMLLASMAYAMPLNSSARSAIPADLLQLISVDYRALKDSPTWKLKMLVDDGAAQGKDLIRDMVRRLKVDIMAARNRLEAIQSTP